MTLKMKTTKTIAWRFTINVYLSVYLSECNTCQLRHPQISPTMASFPRHLYESQPRMSPSFRISSLPCGPNRRPTFPAPFPRLSAAPEASHHLKRLFRNQRSQFTSSSPPSLGRYSQKAALIAGRVAGRDRCRKPPGRWVVGGAIRKRCGGRRARPAGRAARWR